MKLLFSKMTSRLAERAESPVVTKLIGFLEKSATCRPDSQ
ncbi:hypothetical protein HMPREF9103_02097 [Lentilactobacillus parafarraginis F0439]|uniref:Uncharacterized protein n=1 Tax=Lentilactobacillus parafarraginis F0439 TaxID=797515 RepID=G9ZQT9_9LACO|nr:hypothetical protein HMPREF9103_02097 [Lentilactobacillus parafarraginis F0439]